MEDVGLFFYILGCEDVIFEIGDVVLFALGQRNGPPVDVLQRIES